MTHLFDTNAWLRVAQRPEEISTAARRAIETMQEPIGLSAISIWEVALKARKGRLTLSLPPEEWLEAMSQPTFVHVLPIDGMIARLAANLPGEFHADPADRFIVATAMALNLTVITSDARILAYSHVRALDTR